jgi:hypothetical protein
VAGCPARRGAVHKTQVLDFSAHYRANVQTAFGRWYAPPVHGTGSGPGKLHQTFTKNAEFLVCGENWAPDDRFAEPPEDKTCRRPVQATVTFEKKGLRFAPGGFYHGKCEFGTPYDPAPLGFDKLDILFGKINKKRLRRSSRPVVATKSDTKTEAKTTTDIYSTITITDRYDGTWTVTFKRKGPWRIWR